ncbi:MAG: hypothetical protein K8U57_35250 [Planctomycetes bacterium]|nr:hypothetical protein [Planctomycetota bacterium]
MSNSKTANNANTKSAPKLQPSQAAEALRKHLGKAYATRSRGWKYFNKERPFLIADPDPGDTWKWLISAAVLDTNPLSLALVIQSVPQSPTMVEYAGSLSGEVKPKKDHATFVLVLPPDDTAAIRKLAGMIRKVETTKWRWLSTKAADALTKLANHLGTLPPAPGGEAAPTPPPIPKPSPPASKSKPSDSAGCK